MAKFRWYKNLWNLKRLSISHVEMSKKLDKAQKWNKREETKWKK